MPGKIVSFDDDTLFRLNELGRNRMATFQELADEAFTDLLKKHGVPMDLKDALKKSVKATPKDKRRTTIADKGHPRRARRPRGG
ncbi:MAG: hypothetical protein WBF99_08495 [Xanthobacteraceae bacterium]